MDLNHIIEDCIKQKRSAQKILYDSFKNKLYSVCVKYSYNIEDAQDNLHNTFIEIFTNIKNYSGNGSFEGWMKRIAINKSIDSYKKTFHLTHLKESKILDEVTIDEELVEHLSLDVLLDLIKALPNQYRLVFTLYELDGYSHKEIAEFLSISLSTSKSNLNRAKVILKAKIEEYNLNSNFDQLKHAKK